MIPLMEEVVSPRKRYRPIGKEDGAPRITPTTARPQATTLRNQLVELLVVRGKSGVVSHSRLLYRDRGLTIILDLPRFLVIALVLLLIEQRLFFYERSAWQK